MTSSQRNRGSSGSSLMSVTASASRGSASRRRRPYRACVRKSHSTRECLDRQRELRRAAHAPVDQKGVVVLADRGREEGMPLLLATGLLRRACGLLLSQPSSQVLLLAPCDDIHTVGMRHAIDVAFVDATGCVIETHRGVGPLRRLKNKTAVAVLERFSSCETPWFECGDNVSIFGKKGGAQ